MRESETQMLITVFGGPDILVSALGVEASTQEERTRILGRFCEYVFKRVILDVAHDHMEGVLDVFEEHRASGRTLESLIGELRRFVPEMDRYVEEETVRAIREFHEDVRK